MKRMLMLLAVAAIALSVQAQMSNDTMSKETKGGGVAQAITQMEQDWAANSKAGKIDAIAPILADSFVNMDSDGTISNKTQSLDRMKGSKWQINQVSDVKVTVHGNTAIASGAWQGKGTMANGKAVDAHEHWVDTWMKMPGGKWQCIASASAPAKM